MGTKSYRPWAPRQSYLMPPSPTDWLREGHLVYFILDIAEQMDLQAIELAIAQRDPRGERPYSPRLMVALLIYGYCVGVFSSRKLARATYEDVAFRVLCGGTHPYFTTINQFRLDHREAFGGLFVQVLRLCRRAGLVKLGHVAIDGTKILANASKHKAMSYERMEAEEARLRGEVNELLARADAADGAEDELYGVGVTPDDLPAELQRRESRIERIAAARAALEHEAAEARASALRQQAESQRAKGQDPTVDPVERRRCATRAAKNEAQADTLDPPDDNEPPPTSDTDLPRHQPPTQPDGTPTEKAQRNFTDPESSIMVKAGAYVQAYNAQIAVDEQAQVIVAQAVTNQPPDQQHWVPMLDRIERNLGRYPRRASADTGYYAEANMKACAPRKVDAYVAVGRQPHRDHHKTRRLEEPPVKAAMRAKLESPAGHKVYSRRKVIVEPPFGQIQAARGFRRFSLRGLLKARCEWALVCLTHNLLKLFRAAPQTVLAV